jgi:hypothetical protein
MKKTDRVLKAAEKSQAILARYAECRRNERNPAKTIRKLAAVLNNPKVVRAEWKLNRKAKRTAKQVVA